MTGQAQIEALRRGFFLPQLGQLHDWVEFGAHGRHLFVLERLKEKNERIIRKTSLELVVFQYEIRLIMPLDVIMRVGGAHIYECYRSSNHHILVGWKTVLIILLMNVLQGNLPCVKNNETNPPEKII
jgi:hypothetical protein